MLRVVVLEAYEPRLKWLACHVVNRNVGPPVGRRMQWLRPFASVIAMAKAWFELTERIVRCTKLRSFGMEAGQQRSQPLDIHNRLAITTQPMRFDYGSSICMNANCH
jgi:hypothetical protein